MTRTDILINKVMAFEMLDSLDSDDVTVNKDINKIKVILQEFHDVMDRTWNTMLTINDVVVKKYDPNNVNHTTEALKHTRNMIATCFNEKNYWDN